MKSPFWFLFDFLSLTTAAVISPLVYLNTSESVKSVANQPVVGSPDPLFKIEAYFHGPKLPMISCLKNTVEFLMILGLQDFLGDMGEVAWKIDDYPQVGMVITPLEYGTIQRRFVIWGLSQGAAHLIDLNRFQAVTFILSWNGERVGRIQLVPWPASHYTHRGIHMNSTQNQMLSDFKSSSSPSLSPKIANMTAQDVPDPRLTVRISLTEDIVPLYDVFALIITVLVDAARLEATERLDGYASPGIAARLDAVFGEVRPARTRPPFFEVQWLIKTMALVPAYMIRKGVFKEASMVIDVDGVSVAAGFLGNLQAGVGLTNAKANVSVS